jgi:PIN domain nuclease of toxin-antitoxin system
VAENFLLDTHALIWLSYEPERLRASVRETLADPDNMVFVSPVSAMEIATKYRIGKLEFARRLADDFIGEVAELGFRHLDLTAAHGQRGGNLAIPHQDPFDRLLIAQAQIEQLRLVSNEVRFDTYGILRLW